MSQDEIRELRERICFGLKQAEVNMLREKAMRGDTVVAVSNGHIKELSAKYLYRKIAK